MCHSTQSGHGLCPGTSEHMAWRGNGRARRDAGVVRTTSPTSPGCTSDRNCQALLRRTSHSLHTALSLLSQCNNAATEIDWSGGFVVVEEWTKDPGEGYTDRSRAGHACRGQQGGGRPQYDGIIPAQGCVRRRARSTTCGDLPQWHGACVELEAPASHYQANSAGHCRPGLVCVRIGSQREVDGPCASGGHRAIRATDIRQHGKQAPQTGRLGD
ncbi:hypothetical protein C8T65DRAFT_261030 [Cerioporus squamosus]|nr:hypothetical protein C8T65DRAFT_261030 [Cerioporus squamosus]